MGWLSRAKGSTDDAGAPGASSPVSAPPTPAAPADAAASAASAGPAASAPTGRYGPLVSVTSFDVAPPELEWQLPLNGELYRLMPGSDRPDYSLLVLERPVHFYPGDGFDLGRVEPEQRVQDRRGRQMVRVHALLLCARFVGQQLHPGMKDLAVNLAYVIDNSLARDAVVDFGKIEFAAVGFLSEGHLPRPADAPDADTASTDAPAASTPTPTSATSDVPAAPGADAAAERVGAVLDGVARTLHAGVAAARGTHVEHLAATITVGPDHRLTGLSGNADGQAPVPTPETFAQVNAALASLAGLGPAGRVASVSLRVEGDTASHEVTATHD
ncbi:hypothetical protein [Intrasporangium sp. YIM S08009]|uniref:hypothetical protein n=1 Tax=Intrasporangium zincisolvens TaxID=3080018 RepID=UPI002B05A921|nr:hypothetical protein [Intrasporangium sp. YIM S08009]